MAVVHNGLEPWMAVRHDQGVFDDQTANAVPDEEQRPCLLAYKLVWYAQERKCQREAPTPPSRMWSTCSSRSSDRDCNVMPSASARWR